MNWIRDNSKISSTDLEKVFKYEEKRTTVITWANDNIKPIVNEFEDSQWEGWLANLCPEHPSSEPNVFIVLAQAGKESPSNKFGDESVFVTTGGGQRNLRTVPFSKETFRRITDTFYIHGSISAVISRADVPVFSSSQVLMKSDDGEMHTAHVYNCRSSNEWSRDLALTVTHLPDLHKTFCIMFGCDEETKAAVIKRLSGIGTEISFPLIMPAILIELERLRHLRVTTKAIESMETKIAELDFDTDKMDEESGPGTVVLRNAARRTTWLDAAYLQNGLISWKFQLEKLKGCVTTYPESHPTKCLRGTGERVAARIEAIEEEYDQIILNCKMRLEGMSMATQWVRDVTYKPASLSNADILPGSRRDKYGHSQGHKSRLQAYESNSVDHDDILTGYFPRGCVFDVFLQLANL
ncbi:hypothetical protein PG984_002792 [Apiospora sp. TS-2023a]